MGKFHFISGSTVKINTYLLFCHFPRSSWPTWKLHHPFSGGKANSVDLSCFTRPNNTFFSSTSALVNKVLGSRATVGHSSSLLNQRKSHRPSLLISAFSSLFQDSLFHQITNSLFQDYPFNSIQYQPFSRFRLSRLRLPASPSRHEGSFDILEAFNWPNKKMYFIFTPDRWILGAQ